VHLVLFCTSAPEDELQVWRLFICLERRVVTRCQENGGYTCYLFGWRAIHCPSPITPHSLLAIETMPSSHIFVHTIPNLHLQFATQMFMWRDIIVDIEVLSALLGVFLKRYQTNTGRSIFQIEWKVFQCYS
jgi:hypothetical protein